jgi:hypothetical protein
MNNSNSNSMIEGHKRIYKANKVSGTGRTIFMAHPLRYRAKKEEKVK